MSKIKTNIKMRVTPKQSRKVQEICFDKGVDWLFTKNTVKLTDKPFLIIRKSRLTYLNISQEKYFNEDENEEVPAELFIRTNGACIETETIKDK